MDCYSRDETAKLVARFILLTDNSMPSDDARKQRKWTQLDKRIRNHKLTLKLKYLHNESVGFNLSLTKHMDIDNYKIRRRQDFTLPMQRTSQLKRAFKYSTIQYWNSLPLEIRKSENIKTFNKFTMSDNFL